MKFVVGNQINPRPCVGRGGEAQVQWRRVCKAKQASLGQIGQGQGAGEASVLRLRKAADAGITQRGLRPALAYRTSAGQPAPSPVG